MAKLYVGGRDRQVGGGTTGFLASKFWPPRANKWDNQWSKYQWNYPNLRLADILLIYAEAVNEVWGPHVTPPFKGGAPTAVRAVNLVRNRATAVDVPNPLTTSKSKFREVIRRERRIELCFEKSDHWMDIRRWMVAEEPEHKKQYKLNFNKQHTYFKKILISTRVFNDRHYWVPFPEDTTNIYAGWPQNPGW